MAKHASKLGSADIKKKEIFKYLDCGEVLPAFLLIYLIFSGIHGMIEKLESIFTDLVNDAKADALANLPEYDDEKERYKEQKLREREFTILLEDFGMIREKTSEFFV